MSESMSAGTEVEVSPSENSRDSVVHEFPSPVESVSEEVSPKAEFPLAEGRGHSVAIT